MASLAHIGSSFANLTCLLSMFPTPHRGVRPFGVSLLIVGYDEETPYLYQCDPSVS